MTASPDPAELTAPRDPASYGRPRRGGGAWTMAAFGVLCVLAGAAIATFGPSLLPARPDLGSLADAALHAAEPAEPTPAIAPAPQPVAASVPVVPMAGSAEVAAHYDWDLATERLLAVYRRAARRP